MRSVWATLSSFVASKGVRESETSILKSRYFIFSSKKERDEMAITKLSNMTLVAQRGTGVCWCASAIMLYKWGRKAGHMRMVDPLTDPGTKWRWDENKSWGKEDNAYLATTLNMQTQSSIPMNYAGLNDFLTAHGPIWAAGRKTWTGEAYGHVVVICGVADTGVLIYDPEPVNQGSSRWLTWNQLSGYVKGIDAAVQFMTVV